MIKHITFAILAAAIGVVGVSSEAHANKWDTIGAACVPDAADIQSDLYSTNGHGVSFAPGKTGTIRLICGLSHITAGSIRDFNMYYTDPDGVGSMYSISVTLQRADIGSTISPAICSVVSSNPGTSFNNCSFDDFSPDQGSWYWYEVLISRSSTASNPEFLGIKTN